MAAADRSSWPAVVAGVMLGVLAVPSAANGQAAATLPCGLEAGPERAVVAVLDGETVRLDDQVEVRLIGALAPRATDVAGAEAGAAWPPEAAARAALAGLVAGKTVALAFAGPRTDRHDRVLAHLFVATEAGQVWVQGRMVESGMARAYSLAGSDACAAQLLERERLARAAGLGVWSHAAYQVRPADRPTELERYQHSFQLVRGRVEQVVARRSGARLDLASGERPPAAAGGSQRGAFRVLWRWPVAREAGLPRPQSFEGRNVLVRGWIESKAGPQIEILAAGQLEIEDDVATAGAATPGPK